MITTEDVKVKPARKDEKLTIISTDHVHPAEFNPKGRAPEPDNIVITTGNMEDFKRNEKKLVMKKKMATVRAGKKKDKTEHFEMEKLQISVKAGVKEK